MPRSCRAGASARPRKCKFAISSERSDYRACALPARSATPRRYWSRMADCFRRCRTRVWSASTAFLSHRSPALAGLKGGIHRAG